MIIAEKEYTHAPNEVQAIKLPDNLNDLTDDEVDFIMDWSNENLNATDADKYCNVFFDDDTFSTGPVLAIETASSHDYAKPGEWVVKGIDGVVYVLTDAVFQQLYGKTLIQLADN